MKPYETTANLIKNKREKIGATQHAVAESLGYHVQYVSNMERGVSGVPATKAKKLARVLGLEHSDIVMAMTNDYALRYQRGK